MKNNDIDPASFKTYRYYFENKDKKDIDIYDLAVERFSDEQSAKYFLTLVEIRNFMEKNRNDHFQAFSTGNLKEHYADYQTLIDNGLVDVSWQCWVAMGSYAFAMASFTVVTGGAGAAFAVAGYGLATAGLFGSCYRAL